MAEPNNAQGFSFSQMMKNMDEAQREDDARQQAEMIAQDEQQVKAEVSEQAEARQRLLEQARELARQAQTQGPVLLGADADLFTWNAKTGSFEPRDEDARAMIESLGDDLQVFQQASGSNRASALRYDAASGKVNVDQGQSLQVGRSDNLSTIEGLRLNRPTSLKDRLGRSAATKATAGNVAQPEAGADPEPESLSDAEREALEALENADRNNEHDTADNGEGEPKKRSPRNQEELFCSLIGQTLKGILDGAEHGVRATGRLIRDGAHAVGGGTAAFVGRWANMETAAQTQVDLNQGITRRTDAPNPFPSDEVPNTAAGVNGDTFAQKVQTREQSGEQARQWLKTRQEALSEKMNTSLETVYQNMGFDNPKNRPRTPEEFQERFANLGNDGNRARKQQSVTKALGEVQLAVGLFGDDLKGWANSDAEGGLKNVPEDEQEALLKEAADLAENPQSLVAKKYQDMLEMAGMGNQPIGEQIGNLLKGVGNALAGALNRMIGLRNHMPDTQPDQPTMAPG